MGELIKSAIVDNPLYDGFRVDRFIAEGLKLCSRSQIPQWVSKILINGRKVKLGKRLKIGDRVVVFYREPSLPIVTPENISLDIIYEDTNILVLNKPQGMVVHPAPGNYSGTIVNALIFRYSALKEQLEDGDRKALHAVRPGIVHRLDKDTSGVLITAKNIETLEFLAEEFKFRRVKKVYLAIVKGSLPKSMGMVNVNLVRDSKNRKRFTWTDTPERGKRAITYYRLLKKFKGYSFVLLRPRTGRTHQLRVHMKYLGCPILGDPIYSRKDKLFPEATLMLHAYKIWVRIPSTSILQRDESRGSKQTDNEKWEVREFKAPLPVRFKRMLKLLARL